MTILLGRLRPLFLCLLVAPAAADGIRQRGPTGAEQASFARFFHRAYPDAGKPPALIASRSAGERRWRVESAPFEAAPARASGALCAADAVQFAFDGQWRASAPFRQVWLAAPDCAAPAGRVRAATEIAQRDAIRLLQRRDAVLARARLLMAGNSFCAAERSSRFALAAILSQAGNKVTLEYRGDRPVVLQVDARLSGADYDVWNVRCASR